MYVWDMRVYTSINIVSRTVSFWKFTKKRCLSLRCVVLELQKAWQAEGFWTFFKHTYMIKRKTVVDSFWEPWLSVFHDRQRDFEHTYMLKSLRKHEFLRKLTMYVCFVFMTGWAFLNKSMHAEDLILQKNLRVYVCMFETWECMYVCMFETYIHTCLAAWDIYTYIHAWRSQTYIHPFQQASGSPKNQVSSKLSRMLQNTYRN